MARNSGKDITAAPASQALSAIDDQLSKEVALLREQLDAPSGNKIKVEVTGEFLLPDGMSLGNSFEAVVVDFYNRNHFFLDPFNPSNITPPDCYAIGKKQLEMAPPDDVPAKQNPQCRDCWANQYKSAPNGKAKACQNRYWLALRLVDPNNPDGPPDPQAPLYILDLSPTNRSGFEGFANYAAQSLGAVIKAQVVVSAKNVGSYAAISFTDPTPNQHYALDFARRAEAEPMLTKKPDYEAAKAAAAAQPQRGRGPAGRRAAPSARRS